MRIVKRIPMSIINMGCKGGNIREQYYSNGIWPILSNVVNYVQFNQHLLGDYIFKAKAPEERYGTEMYRSLQV